MAYTLLTTVKSILSEMSSDMVDSITDTIESRRVASLVIDVYQSTMTEFPWLVNENFINPVSSRESLIELQPMITHVKKVFIKPSNLCGYYGGSTEYVVTPLYKLGGPVTSTNNTVVSGWVELQYVDKEDMLALTYKDAQPNTSGIAYSIYGYHTGTQANPRFYTTIHNHVVLDSMCRAEGANFPLDHIRLLGQYTANIPMQDGAVINLNPQLYSYFLAECKSQAFASIKQMPNQKIEQVAQRLKRQLMNSKSRQGKGNTKIKYENKATWRF